MGGKTKEERETRKEKAISPTAKLSLFLAEKAVASPHSLTHRRHSKSHMVGGGREGYVCGKRLLAGGDKLGSSVFEGRKERACGHVCPKGKALTATRTVCPTFC